MLGEYYQAFKETELNLYEFSLLVLIYEQNFDFLEETYSRNFINYDSAIDLLESKSFIKRFGEEPTDITLRKYGEDFFAKHFSKKKKDAIVRGPFVHVWIDAWRELFPKGSNTSGYRYRGNRLEALKKMTKFVDSYDFTKDEIFEATRRYVDKFAMKGYMYMQQAHYFIDKKDSGSSLASECEGVRENVDLPVKQGDGYGERLI